MRSLITVVGSLNMDIVSEVERGPLKGETILSHGFFMNAGGKGANQAYAAAKMGADVTLLGRVGDDEFADKLINNLDQAGVNVSFIEKMPAVSTGVALITIADNGDNSIIVSQGANQGLKPGDVEQYEEVVQGSKLLVVQLEIPLGTVTTAIHMAFRNNVPILLDPAPAIALPDTIMAMVDYITPNEKEMMALTGIEPHDLSSAEEAAKCLLNKGVKNVIAKLGANGVAVINDRESYFVEPYKVAAVDTTAAGDAFAGSLAAALATGRELKEAVHLANAVGAMTVTRKGAQSSIPSLPELEQFIAEYAK